MVQRVVLAIIVGVVVAIAVALIGSLLVEFGVPEVGNFLKGVSSLLGLLAGLWHFFAGSDRSTV